jgi:hypothetical protein
MSDPVRHLRQDVLRARQGTDGRGIRYPSALRSAILGHVRKRRARGEPLAAIGRDLGLNAFTLQRWLDGDRSPGFRPVEVAADAVAAAPGPVVVTLGGLRIEGLDVAGVAALLRALA